MMMRAVLLIAAIFTSGENSAQYLPPIGIPVPSFGLTNTVSDTAYTHWVDNSGTCSNASNGTPALPRCTIPATVPAGSIVQVRGGPYTYAANILWTSPGSSAQPSYIRGPSAGPRPHLINPTRKLAVGGSYVVVEYFDLETRILVNASTDHHIVVRHNAIYGQALANCATLAGSDSVLWENEIHHCTGDDRHGVSVSAGSQRAWVLENTIHHFGGDGFQACHNCSLNPPRDVYIGRNVITGGRENAVDLKWITNVVVSENIGYGFRPAPAHVPWCASDGSFCIADPSSGSDGAAVVIGSDGGPTNAWVLYNDIFDSQIGIRHESSCVGATCSAGTGPAYTIGNRIHDILGDALVAEKTTGVWWLANNVIERAGGNGLAFTFGAPKELHLDGNVFANVAGSVINIPPSGFAPASTLDRTQFWPSPATIAWGTAPTVYATDADVAPLGTDNAFIPAIP